MKYINKNPEPQSFIEWKAMENEDWKPSWGTLEDSKDVKRELKQSLIEEQGYICCYCEIRIELSTSHIEHLKPRKSYKKLNLNIYNLVQARSGIIHDLCDLEIEEIEKILYSKGRYYPFYSSIKQFFGL